VTELSQDGGVKVTYPDGTVDDITYGPDPRFGMQSPVMESLTRTLPDGTTAYHVTGARTVTYNDPLDPIGGLATLHNEMNIENATYAVDYDRASLTVTQSTPEYRSRTVTYDAQGRVAQANLFDNTDPIIYTRDANGQVTQVAQGAEYVNLAYDAFGRVTTVTDALNRVTHYAYNADNLVTSITSPGGQVTQLKLDSAGNLVQVTMPNQAVHQMQYQAGNETAYILPGSAGQINRTYSLDGELTQLAYPTGRMVTQAFDALTARLTSQTFSEGSIAFTYNASDQLASMARTPGQTTDYSYNGMLMTQQATSGVASADFTYSYDPSLNLGNIHAQIGATATDTPLTHDNDGMLTGIGPFTLSRNGPGGLTNEIWDDNFNLSYSYDNIGRIDEVSSSTSAQDMFQENLTYDAGGQLTEADQSINDVDSTLTYTYDANGQLLTVKRDGVKAETYTYDANGNRTSRRMGTGTVEKAVFNSQDHITTFSGVAYTYNADGQLIQRGSDTFTYSTRGELLQAVVGGQTITYAYDALRRRVQRTDSTGSWSFYYDNPTNPYLVTQSKNPSGVITEYFYDENGYLIGFRRGGVMYYSGSDHLGTPWIVVDEANNIQKQLTYDAYGKVLTDSDPSFELLIGFSGGLYDPATRLLRFGLRDYDPNAGSWTMRDPALYQGSQYNLYAYIQNNPVQFRDPFGLGFGFQISGYEGVGGELELMISSQGFSFCSGVGFGVGGSIGPKTGDPVARSGVSLVGELSAGAGPIRVGTGFVIDPCQATLTAPKLTVGPLKIDSNGNAQVSVKDSDWSADDWNLKAGGKVAARFCYSSLDH
jgi:RHS repeat-associated protein